MNKQSILGCTAAALFALASGAALAQGASGIGAAANAPTIGHSVDANPGTTGIVHAEADAAASTRTAAVPATAAMGASAAVTTGSSPVLVSRHWVDVPANVEARSDFRRWMRLR